MMHKPTTFVGADRIERAVTETCPGCGHECPVVKGILRGTRVFIDTAARAWHFQCASDALGAAPAVERPAAEMTTSTVEPVRPMPLPNRPWSLLDQAAANVRGEILNPVLWESLYISKPPRFDLINPHRWPGEDRPGAGIQHSMRGVRLTMAPATQHNTGHGMRVTQTAAIPKPTKRCVDGWNQWAALAQALHDAGLPRDQFPPRVLERCPAAQADASVGRLADIADWSMFPTCLAPFNVAPGDPAPYFLPFGEGMGCTYLPIPPRPVSLLEIALHQAYPEAVRHQAEMCLKEAGVSLTRALPEDRWWRTVDYGSAENPNWKALEAAPFPLDGMTLRDALKLALQQTGVLMGRTAEELGPVAPYPGGVADAQPAPLTRDGLKQAVHALTDGTVYGPRYETPPPDYVSPVYSLSPPPAEALDFHYDVGADAAAPGTESTLAIGGYAFDAATVAPAEAAPPARICSRCEAADDGDLREGYRGQLFCQGCDAYLSGR